MKTGRSRSVAAMGRPARIVVLGLTAALFLGAAALAATTTETALASAAAFAVVSLLGLFALFLMKAVLESASRTRSIEHHLNEITTRVERARSQDQSRLTQLEQRLDGVKNTHDAAVAKLGTDLDRDRASVSEQTKAWAEQLRVINEQLASHGQRLAATQAEFGQLRVDLDEATSRLETRVSSFNLRIRKLERADSSVPAVGAPSSAASVGSLQGDLNDLGSSAAMTTPDAIAKVVEDVNSGRVALEHVSDDFPEEVVGLSGRRFRTLVANLVEALGEHGGYLEIGTYRGKTLCTSALLNPRVHHVGVDNFSFEGEHNRQIFEGLVDSLGLTNVDFYEDNFFEWLVAKAESGQRDVAVYYFDASHDYRSQLLALLYGAKVTMTGGVMLVDDCNYSHVRAATYDFCELHPDWALLFERYTQGHPNRASDDVRAEMSEGWWNGVHVLVHDPTHQLQRLDRQQESTIDRFFLEQHKIENCVTDGVISRLAGATRGPAIAGVEPESS